MNQKEIHEFIESLDCSCEINFEKDRLYFSYTSKITFLLGILVGIIFTGLYVYLMKDSIIKVNPTGRDFDPKIIGILCFFASTLYAYSLIKSYKVIDFGNNIIYNELRIFGLAFRFNKINKKNIVQIGNNSIQTQMEVYSETNKTPDYTHQYFISFLTDEGTKVDFIKLGNRNEIHETSLKLVNFISEYWNLPQFVSNNKKQLGILKQNSKYSFIEKPF